MDPKHPADPTVGEIRWLGAQTVIVGCKECSYQQVANIAKLPESVPLQRIAALFVCPRCQNTGAYVLPKWDAERSHASREFPTAEARQTAAADSSPRSIEPSVSKADSVEPTTAAPSPDVPELGNYILKILERLDRRHTDQGESGIRSNLSDAETPSTEGSVVTNGRGKDQGVFRLLATAKKLGLIRWWAA
jgi:hypothetical protein